MASLVTTTVAGTLDVKLDAGLTIERTSVDSRFRMFNTGGEWILAATFGGTGAYDPIKFQTSDVTRLTIAANGTATFAGVVKLGNNSMLSDATTSSVSLNSSSDVLLTAIQSGAVFAIKTWNGSTQAERFKISGAGATATTAITGNATVSGTISGNTVTADSTNHLFIGKVSGTDQGYLSYTGNYWWMRGAAGKEIRISANNSTADGLVVKTGGHVGIGTNAPSSLLNVYAAANQQFHHYTSGSYTVILALGRAKGGASLLEIKYDSAGAEHAYISRAYTNATLHFDKQGTDHMTILGDGNVGIGTTNPGEMLQVGDGTVNGTSVKVSSASWAQLKLISPNTNGAYIMFGDPEDEDIGNIFYYHGSNANYMSFTTNASEQMRIDKNGNVGIGADVPASKLHVRVGTNQNLEVTSSSSELNIWGTNDARSAGIPVRFSFTEYNFLDGNVGIGTAAPGALLHTLKAAAHNFTYLDTYSATNGHSSTINFRKSDNNTGGTKTQTDDGDSLGTLSFYGVNTGADFGVAAAINVSQQGASGASFVPCHISFATCTASAYAEQMRILPDGNVGIGTTAPGSLLTIRGNSDDGDEACALRIVDADSTVGSKLPAIMFYGGSTLQGRIRGGDGTFSIAVGSTPTNVIEIDTATQAATFSGELTVEGDFTNVENLYVNQESVLDGHTYPYADSSYTLGTDALRWSTIYGDTGNFSGTTAGQLLGKHNFYHGSIANFDADEFFFAFKVTGDHLVNIVKLSLKGVSSSGHLQSHIIDIQVCHYQDILVRSWSGFYNQLIVKVISDGNGNFDVFLKSTVSGSYNHNMTLDMNIQTLTNDTFVTFPGSGTYSTITHEHTTKGGTVMTGNNGTSGSDGYANFEVDGTGTFGGNVSITRTTTALLTIQGASSGYVNAGIVLKATDGSNYRGLGVFMHDAGGDTEWYAGRPYASSDQYIIARKASQASHSDAVAERVNALFTLKSDGNVGIGTSDPSQLLDVYKATVADSAQVLLKVRGTNDAQLKVEGANDNTSVGYGTNRSGGALQLRNTNDTVGNYESICFSNADNFINAGIHAINVAHGEGSATRGKIEIWTRNVASNYHKALEISDSSAVTFCTSSGVTAYTLPNTDGTAGYHLQTNGSGTVTWAAGGAGTVTGTGTANYVSKWTNTSVQGNSQIFDDGTSVGIGESAPSSQLSIGGNSTTTLKPTVAIVDMTAGAMLQLRGQAPTIFMDSTSSGIPTILTDGRGIEIKDGTLDAQGTVDFVIASDGNVGIGTTNPSKGRLQVGAGNDYIAITDANAGYARIGNFNISGCTVSLESAGDAQIVIDNNNNGTNVFKILQGGHTGTELLRVQEDGNVGIGTTAPARALQVHNSGGVGGWISTTDNTTGATNGDGLLMGCSGVGSYIWNYEAGPLYLGTSNLTRVTISSAGAPSFIGTGTSFVMDVGSSTQTSYTDIRLNSNSGTGEIWKNGTGYTNYAGAGGLNVYCSNGAVGIIPGGSNAYMTIFKADGNVGIGTAAPGALLHTLKAAAHNFTYLDTYSATNGHSSTINFRKSDNNTGGTKTQTDDGDSLGTLSFYGVNTGSDFGVAAAINVSQQGTSGASFVPCHISFATCTASAYAEQMRILPNGRVGIGTTDPGYSLDVNGTANIGGALTVRGLFTYDNSPAANGTGDLKIIPSASASGGVGYATQIIGVNIADALSNNFPKQLSTWGGVTGSSAIAINADDNTYGQFMVLTAPQNSSANTELTPRFWITGAGAATFSGEVTVEGDFTNVENLYVNQESILDGHTYPYADSAYTLGTSALRWSTIYGDTAILGNADGTGLLLGVAAFGGAANQRLQIGATLAGSSSATAQISGLTRVGYIITHNTAEGIRPNANGQSTCGTSAQRWSNLYSQAGNFSGAVTIGNNVPMWSGSYGGALVLKGNNATADRYAQLAIVDSTGALINTGLVVANSGNVGIGTTDPGVKLDVRGAGNTSQNFFEIKDSDGASQFLVASDAGGDGFLQLSDTNGAAKAVIHSGGDSYFNGGDVVIGNTSAGAYEKLLVDAGGAIAYGNASPRQGAVIANTGSGTFTLNSDWVKNWHKIGGLFVSSETTNNYANYGIVAIGRSNGGTATGGSFSAEDIHATGTAYGIHVKKVTAWSRFGIYDESGAAWYTSGSVGIGDASPSYKLDVNGTLRATGTGTFDSSLSVGDDFTAIGNCQLGNSYADSHTIYGQTTFLEEGTEANSIYVRNVTNDGRASISFSDITGESQKGYLRYAHADSRSNGTGNSFHFDCSGETATAVIIDQTAGHSGFYVGSVEDAATYKVAIRGGAASYFMGGSVGIGTTAPVLLLHLNQAAGANIQFSNATTGRYFRIGEGVGGNDRFSFRGNSYRSTDTLTVDFANNRVGINDINPSYTLDVNGTFRVTGGATFGGALTGTTATFSGQVKTTNQFRISADYAVQYFYKANNSTMLGYLLMRDNAANYLSTAGGQDFAIVDTVTNTRWITFQTSTKNVGIGIADPGIYKLNVVGAGYFSSPVWTANGAGLGSFTAAGTAKSVIYMNGSDEIVINSQQGGVIPTRIYGDYVTFETADLIGAPRETMRIVGSAGVGTKGKVGIGTTNPSHLLEVYEGSLLFKNTQTAPDDTAIRIECENNNITLMRFDASTDQVNNSANYGFSLKYMGARSGNYNSFSIFSDNQLAGTQIEALTVFQDGKVGIGITNPTSTPSSMFRVDGSISGTSKNFDIPHPDPSKLNARLIHASVEAPSNDTLYRFEVITSSDKETVTHPLPGYFKHLNKDPQMWIQARNMFSHAYGSCAEDLSSFSITGEKAGSYDVLIIATRKDKAVEGFVVERDG